MNFRSLRMASLLLAPTLLWSRCDRPSQRAARATVSADTTVAAVYRRRLVFVGGSPDSLVAALLHFTALPERGRQVRHAAYGWIGTGIGWDPLISDEWRGEPLRDPSMILPHGSLRLRVGDADALEELVAGRLRLDPGARVTEWTQPDVVRLQLLRTSAALDSRDYAGALLAVEDAPGPPTPPADTVPTTEALLTDGTGGFFVFIEGPDLPATTLETGLDSEPVRAEALRIRPDSAGAMDADGRPTAWRIQDENGRVVGSLHRIGPGWAGQSDQPGYRLFDGVRGELRQNGRQRRVAGILERRRQ